MTPKTILTLATAFLAACASTEDTAQDTAPPSGDVSLEDIATEDTDGTSILDGETVTTTGLATVGSGVLSGRKLRIHIQDGGHGCAIDADEVVAAELIAALGDIVEGDELRITGLVTQEDLPSNDQPGAHDGLTRVRIEDSTMVERLSAGNPLPEPLALGLDQIFASGDDWEGILVRLDGVHKSDGDADTWVSSLDSSAILDVYDAQDTGPLKVRLGNGERTGGYGDDPGQASFDLVGLLREDTTIEPDSDPDGSLFEVWPRGEQDILRDR
jgi:hypothetical protein